MPFKKITSKAVVQEKNGNLFLFFHANGSHLGGCPSKPTEERLNQHFRIWAGVCMCVSLIATYNHGQAATLIDPDPPPRSCSPLFSVSGLWIWIWHVWLDVRSICWANFLGAHKNRRSSCIRIYTSAGSK